MMLDSVAEVFRTSPERLARILDLLDGARPDFRPEELGPVLRHQLRSRVEFDLLNLDPGRCRLLRAAGELAGGTTTIRTFSDLFRHPQPPLPLLHLTKNFAKHHLHHPDSCLPPEIATVLYYASIVAALLRWERHITWLTDEELRQGLEQVLQQTWLDEETRALLNAGRQRLSPPRWPGADPARPA